MEIFRLKVDENLKNVNIQNFTHLGIYTKTLKINVNGN